MSDLTRRILDSLFPKGAAWTPRADGFYDKYLDAQAENIDPVVDFLGLLSKIRDPQKTFLLEELERESGTSKNSSLTEQQRRDFLSSIISRSEENGTPEELQRKLQDGGFDVQVHSNDPATNPLVILDAFGMTCGSANAFAGNEMAFAKRGGAELIVNGDKFKKVPNYTVVCGGANAYAGRPDFVAGVFDGLLTEKIEYSSPTKSGDWPFIFFIGGDAIKDIDGKIVSIETIFEPKELRNEFLKIILKYKPLYTWVVSTVNFI